MKKDKKKKSSPFENMHGSKKVILVLCDDSSYCKERRNQFVRYK